MEFNEKLQELRKNKGLTQEELAEALYVSRTAISKWESGRGYPNIDSLKEISNYFSVSIDDLLSGDKLISIAQNENKSNIRNICGFLFGFIDLCSLMLVVFPLYPNTVDGYVYSVNLFAYSQSSIFSVIYWIMFISLTLLGFIKVLMTKVRPDKNYKLLMEISIILNILIVVFLALRREAYAVTITILLLVIKGFIFIKNAQIGR